MTSIVISISPTGGLQSLHDDRFPLVSISKGVTMARASMIEWDEGQQSWTVHVVGTDYDIKGFRSYEDARKFEVMFLNLCREHTLEVNSQCARVLAYNLLMEFGGAYAHQETEST